MTGDGVLVDIVDIDQGIAKVVVVDVVPCDAVVLVIFFEAVVCVCCWC